MAREAVTERLARLRALAERVWGDAHAANAFMRTPHPLLGGRAPARVARTAAGARRVEKILNRLEHSLPV